MHDYLTGFKCDLRRVRCERYRNTRCKFRGGMRSRCNLVYSCVTGNEQRIYQRVGISCRGSRFRSTFAFVTSRAYESSSIVRLSRRESYSRQSRQTASHHKLLTIALQSPHYSRLNIFYKMHLLYK